MSIINKIRGLSRFFDVSQFSERRVIMPVSKELLEILACPKCKGNIRLNKAQNSLICDNCRLLYHIKGDTPVMLIDEAEEIKD